MAKPVQRNKDRKREEIQRAFADSINQSGYDGVTVRQIARRAGVSVGLVYHYYPGGKPSIAAAIYQEGFRRTIIPYAFDSDPGKIEEMIRAHLDNHREHIRLYRAFDQALLTNQEVWGGVKADRRQLLEGFARESGYPLDGIDAWLTAYAVVDAIIHRHLTIDRVCDSDAELVRLIKTVYTAILADKHPR